MTVRRHPDEAGVSNVLGAVLMFGLLVVTLVMVQVQFAPRWEEDRESRHMDEVVEQLSLFTSDIDRLTTNATSGAVTDPVTIGRKGGFTFFQSPSLGGTASFTPATGSGFQLSSPQLRVLVQDGEELFGLDEGWEPIELTGEQLSDVAAMRHLRVRVDMSDTYDDGDSATITVTDADGDFAGRATITFRDFPSEQALEIKTYNANDTEISSDLEAFFQQTNVDYFYIDLLDTALFFRDVLAVTETPYSLDLTNTGLDAGYSVVFFDSSGSTGGSSSGPGGFVIPNYSSSLSSGAFAVELPNQQLPEQTYVVEHGAILLEQADGVAMVSPPAFSARASTTSTVLELTVPGLDGATASLTGERRVSLVAVPSGSRVQLEALAPRLTFTVPTQYPDVWAAYFEDTLELAGLEPTQFSITTTPTSVPPVVSVTVIGRTAADTSDDISLVYQQAALALTILPAG